MKKCLTLTIFLFLIVSAKAQNSSVENQILLGNFLNDIENTFTFSDTWFSKNLLFGQSPYNSTALKYNNVYLNSMVDGSMRPDYLIPHNSSFIANRNKPDLYSTSNSLGAYIDINKPSYDTNLFKAVIQGGNIFGSNMVDYYGKKKNWRWNSSINYITSENFDKSSSHDYSTGLTRINSDFRSFSGNLRVGVYDNNSMLDAEFIYTSSVTGIPFELNKQNAVLIREPDYKFNLLNIQFASSLNSNFKIEGNLFYIRNKTIIESSLKSIVDSDSTYKKSFEENKFGWNSRLIIKNSLLPPTEISFNYSREALKYQANQGLSVEQYEIEKLVTGIKMYDKFEYWSYDIAIKYMLHNPLTILHNNLAQSNSNIEYYSDFDISVFKQVSLLLNHSRISVLPPLYYTYPSLNHGLIPINDKSFGTKYSYSLGVNLKMQELSSLELHFFHEQSSNQHLPYSLLNYNHEMIPDGINSNGMRFCLKSDLYIFKLHSNLDYYTENVQIFDSYGREIAIPSLQVHFRVFDEYNFGLKWLMEYSHAGDRKSVLGEAVIEDFSLINLHLCYKVYKQNELFVSINNLGDVNYEFIKGYPMPGINFIAGFKLIL